MIRAVVLVVKGRARGIVDASSSSGGGCGDSDFDRLVVCFLVAGRLLLIPSLFLSDFSWLPVHLLSFLYSTSILLSLHTTSSISNTSKFLLSIHLSLVPYHLQHLSFYTASTSTSMRLVTGEVVAWRV